MIGELIGDWIKGILIDGIMGNLSGLFSTVNTKVGEIASDVGTTPQAWNSGIFNMLQSLSDTVIVPIAAAILAVIMCYELIDMIVEKNNMQFTVEEENLICMYHKSDRRRTAANIRAALPDMDEDMAALARQTADKLDAMNDADFEARQFHFTDE